MVGLALALVVTCLARRPRAYHPLSVVVFAAVFGVNAWSAYREVQTQAENYPLESIEGRLPERPAGPDPDDLPKSVLALESDGTLDQSGSKYYLQELHENATRTFVNRPGFGVMRMSGRDFEMMRVGRRSDTPIPQPGERSASADVLENTGTTFPLGESFDKLHRGGVLDFAHPLGFGYVKDRQHVAGFQSHRFSKVPDGAEPWRVRTLDLIGLVVHREPVAYVSDSLPQMDELRRVPTRRLFPFEEAALSELRKGADLHARELPDGSVRMVGAVRALKQCLDCHGGRRGDLLGAFSYELRKN